MNVVLDPQGKLFFGSQHVIPFDVVRGDVYVDVIALCPLPQLIEFALQTPSGKIIKATPAQPNVQFIKGQQVLCYRVVLPALPKDPGGSHAGRWHAILSLRKQEDVPKLLRSRAALEAQAAANWLPYSLIVHAFSNLKFEASLHLDSQKPGAVATLTAALLEYDVPFTGQAAVWADVVTPTGATMTVALKPDAQLAGSYSGSFTTVAAGVYDCRVRAEGYSSTGQRFTREKRLTVGVYYQEIGTVPPGGSWTSDICKLLNCLVSEKVLTERAAEKLRESGVDLQALRECLRAKCQSSGPGERIPGVPTMPSSKRPSAKRSAKRAEPRLEIGTESPAKPIKPAKSEPAPAPPHAAAMGGAAGTWPRVIRMFTRPEELEAQMGAHTESTPAKRPAKRSVKKRRR
jgi:hypothetical protein